MRVTSFIGPNSTWAFTGTVSGCNLPPSHGPWLPYKQYNMHRGQKLMIAVDVDWIIDAVERGGYYLTTMARQPCLGRAPLAAGIMERSGYRKIGPVLIADDIAARSLQDRPADPAAQSRDRPVKKRQIPR